MKKTIRHVIFDLGQVFITVDLNTFAKNFSEEFSVDPAELMHDDFNGVHKDFMVGRITGEDFHRLTCERFNHFVPFDKFRQIWESMLIAEVPGTAAIVEKLEEQEYSIALLSNTDPWHYEYSLNHIPILKRIDKNFLSYDLKMKKPDVEIFQTTARKLKANPDECLFIDDLQPNIDGAKSANLNAIQFINAEQLRRDLKQFGIDV